MADKTRPKPSKSVENFLKAVYALQKENERVSTNALAQALNILPPSVTDMARRLAETGLVDYQRYYGVRLTPDGEATALRVIRRHRLVELFLAQELGYALPEVHEEADQLEHVVSERFIRAIDARMGYPAIDPHGDPIPAENGAITQRDLVPLAQLPDGARGRVSRFSCDDAVLKYVLARGFALGTEVKIIAKDPFDGPVTVSIDGRECAIGRTVAVCILVDPIHESG